MTFTRGTESVLREVQYMSGQLVNYRTHSKVSWGVVDSVTALHIALHKSYCVVNRE
jgi:hypothetical protein